jgi:hypothetical protein
MEEVKLSKVCYVKLVERRDRDRGRGPKSGFYFKRMTVVLEVVQAIVRRLPS